MSMFQVCGRVINVYEAPGRKDKTTGEVDDDKPKVQILGEVPQRNGQVKLELVDLTCRVLDDFRPYLGKRVTVPLGIYAVAQGRVVYFVPEGGKPEAPASLD